MRSATRPVPLVHDFRMVSLTETLEELLATHQTPVYVVHFTQAAAVERAQALMSINVCTRAEKDAIAEAIGGFRFAAGFGKTLSRFVRHGIGVHHAGMLPKYRRLVERLAQAGLLKVICGTDTLGVGINVPIRTVVFTALSKYDGTSTRLLSAREFHQIGGRAGRAGFDTMGTVIALAPEHVIENARLLAKAGDDPRKQRRVVRKKPPPGMVSWGQPTFDRLVAAPPEPLTSSFTVSHSMLMNVLDRPGDGRAALARLLADNYEPEAERARHTARAAEIEASLLDAGVVEELEVADEHGRTVRVTIDLQAEFALNQPLAPFALAALDLLDPESPTHALDVVSVIESVLEDPRQIISAQRFKARGEAVARMKADGLEYEERMAELDLVTHPQPLAELLEPMFEVYRQSHPWVADHPLRPKSIARDLYERAMDFTDYVRFYELARSEGIVLRYLSDAYKTLVRTVPEQAKTEELIDITEWLGELVRQVDSSLLDEWEALTNPTDDDVVPTRRRPATAGHGQPPRLHRAGPQRAVPPGGAGRPEALVRTRRARRRRRLDGRPVVRGAGPLLRRARLPRHRSRRPLPRHAPRRRAPRPVGRAADPRRPRGRARLGDHRGGRPARLGRGRHRGGAHRRRGRPLTVPIRAPGDRSGKLRWWT